MAPILEKDQINDLVTLIQTRFLQLEFDFLRFIFTSENLEIFFFYYYPKLEQLSSGDHIAIKEQRKTVIKCKDVIST